MKDKNKIKAELQQIQGRRDLLRPEEVVAWAAKNHSSGLYKEFEWNDAKCGIAHRLQQARELIKLFVIREESAPCWLSLSIDRVGSGGYRNAENVKQSPKLRDVLIHDVLGEFLRLRNRYADLNEFASIYKAIDRLVASSEPETEPVQPMRSKVNGRAQAAAA